MITLDQAMAEARKQSYARRGIACSAPDPDPLPEPAPGRAGGPRTTQGKAVSSNNALKHGLTARKTVLPSEDQAEFDKLLASTIEDRKPEGEVERQLATEIASCIWRLDRARRYESLTLNHHACELFNSDTEAGRGFDRLQRYAGSIERQLNRAILRLQQLQAERRKQAPPATPPAPAPKFLTASAGSEAPAPAPEFVSSAPDQFVSSISEPAPAPSDLTTDNRQLTTCLPCPQGDATVRE